MTGEQRPGNDEHLDGLVDTPDGKGFSNLIKLSVRSFANRIKRSFPLTIRLEVDEMRLTIKPKSMIRDAINAIFERPEEEVRLRVRLKHCHVRYRSSSLEILDSSKYRSAAALGKYVEEQAVVAKNASERGGGTSGGAKVGLSKNPSASFNVGANYGQKSSSTRSDVSSTTASRDIYQVEAVPDGWQIGDYDLGDPVKAGGFLHGPYFAKDEPAFPSSCVAQFRDGCRQGEITFEVTTADGLHVERIDGSTSQPDRRQGLATMRDKIAAICIERHAVQGDEDLLLFTLTVECAAAVDEEEGDGE